MMALRLEAAVEHKIARESLAKKKKKRLFQLAKVIVWLKVNGCCIYHSINKHLLFCLQKANDVACVGMWCLLSPFTGGRNRRHLYVPCCGISERLLGQPHATLSTYRARGTPHSGVCPCFGHRGSVSAWRCPKPIHTAALVCWHCWRPVWLPLHSPAWSSAPPWLCGSVRSLVFLFFFSFFFLGLLLTLTL